MTRTNMHSRTGSEALVGTGNGTTRQRRGTGHAHGRTWEPKLPPYDDQGAARDVTSVALTTARRRPWIVEQRSTMPRNRATRAVLFAEHVMAGAESTADRFNAVPVAPLASGRTTSTTLSRTSGAESSTRKEGETAAVLLQPAPFVARVRTSYTPPH